MEQQLEIKQSLIDEEQKQQIYVQNIIKTMQFRESLDIIWELLIKVFPSLVSIISYSIILFTNMIRAKQFNDTDVTAAVGFGHAILNGLCTNLFLYFNTGFITIGCRVIKYSKTQVHIYFYKQLILILSFSIIVVIIVSNIILITNLLNIEIKTGQKIHEFLNSVIYSGIIYGLYDLIRQLLLVNQQFKVLATLFFLSGALLHTILSGILIEKYGLTGLSKSMNISMLIPLILITIYAIKLKVLTAAPITIQQILQDSYQYYKEVLQIAMILYMDTLCFNGLAVIASTLGSLYLASHTILITFYSLCCTFTFALQITLNNQISFYFSTNNIVFAIKIIVCSIIINSLLLLVICYLMFFHAYLVFNIFTNDSQILQLLKSVIFYFCFMCFCDLTNINLQAVTKSIDYTQQTLNIYFFAYYVWTLPLAIILSQFYYLNGIWIAFGSGCAIIMFRLLYLIFNTDFQKQYSIMHSNKKITQQIELQSQ